MRGRRARALLLLDPLLPISPFFAASLKYELPLKGISFWLSSFCAVLLASVATKVSPILTTRGRYLTFVVATIFCIVPIAPSISKTINEERLGAGWHGMLIRHLNISTNGYFRYWPDERAAMSEAHYDLYRFLLNEIRSGNIKQSDTIAHFASGVYPWEATPFPAFTGIKQDLFVNRNFRHNIHTYRGRIHYSHEVAGRAKDVLESYRLILLESDYEAEDVRKQIDDFLATTKMIYQNTKFKLYTLASQNRP